MIFNSALKCGAIHLMSFQDICGVEIGNVKIMFINNIRRNAMTKTLLLGSLISKSAMLLLSLAIIVVSVMIAPSTAVAEDKTVVVAEETVQTPQGALGMKYIGAGVAVGIGSIAGGIAVAAVGSAAMGAVVERPELMGRSLIYVGLAEGIAIYGMVVAIMILLA